MPEASPARTSPDHCHSVAHRDTVPTYVVIAARGEPSQDQPNHGSATPSQIQPCCLISSVTRFSCFLLLWVFLLSCTLAIGKSTEPLACGDLWAGHLSHIHSHSCQSTARVLRPASRVKRWLVAQQCKMACLPIRTTSSLAQVLVLKKLPNIWNSDSANIDCANVVRESGVAVGSRRVIYAAATSFVRIGWHHCNR